MTGGYTYNLYKLVRIFFIKPILFITFFIIFQSAIGQESDRVKNILPSVFQAGPTVFNITIDDQGVLFFGTNKGVGIYNGSSWDLSPISNFSDVSTLEKGPHGRIWVGANGNFGYLVKDIDVGYKYVSLTDSSKISTIGFTNIWQIVFLNDDVYFMSYEGIFKYSNQEVSFENTPNTYIYNINNKLFGSSYDTGEFGPLVDNKVVPVKGSKNLDYDLVFQIFEPSLNEFILVTSDYGLFRFNSLSGEIDLIDSDGTIYLGENGFYDGIMIESKFLALGTWEGGLILTDTDGKLLSKFDNKSGLLSDLVYDLVLGNNNDLWAATTTGISKVSLNDSISGFSDSNYIANDPEISRLNFSIGDSVFSIFPPIDNIYKLVDGFYLIDNNNLTFLQRPSTFSISYAAPFFAGENTMFSVFLEGYDKKWSGWMKAPLKEYTNLNAGDYTLHVQAKKVSTGELSKVKSMNITIQTPWYKSLWFYLIAIILLIAFLYFLIRNFIIRLKRQNYSLERVVQRRTKHLKEQQNRLNELNKNLILSNKELDNMVHHTSHDLKAPLKSVLGLLDLAKREDVENKLAQYLEMMENSIHKLETKISATLKLSKNSKADLNVTLIDFKKIINEALEEIQYHDAIEKIDIRQKIDTTESFFSDERRLHIIVNNLISNSVKYYDNAKPQPYISIDIKTKNDYAEIIIQDNGLGIQQDKQKEVFEIFQRASDKSYGTGLGLFIVKETVTKMDGTIQLESNENEYCTFSIELPNMKNMVTV